MAANDWLPTGFSFVNDDLPAAVQPAAPAPALAPALPVADDIKSILDQVSQAHGVDRNVLDAFARVESNFNPKVTTGSYKGLFQLSDDEFAKHGGRGDIYDPTENANAAAVKIKAEAADFERRFGRAPTAAEIYLVHQQGIGGAAAHLSNPDAPAWQNMAETAEGRQKGDRWAKKAIWGNLTPDARRRFGDVNNITSRDFTDFWANRVGEFPSIYAQAEAAAEEPRMSLGGPKEDNWLPPGYKVAGEAVKAPSPDSWLPPGFKEVEDKPAAKTGANDWVEGEKAQAKRMESFWSKVHGYTQGYNDWLDRKVSETIDDSKKRYADAEAVETGAKAAPKTGLARHLAERVGEGLLDGVVANTVKGMAYTSDYIRGKPLTETEENGVYKVGAVISEYAKHLFPKDEARQHEFSAKLANGVGSMVGFMGPGLAVQTLVRAGPKTLGLIMGGTSGATGAMAQAGNMTDEAVKKFDEGKTVDGKPITEENIKNTFLASLPIGATEALPIAHMFMRSGGAWVNRIIAQSIEEGGQEWGQQVLENLTARANYDDKRRWDDNAWEGLAIGGILGAGMQGGMELRSRGRDDTSSAPPAPAAPVPPIPGQPGTSTIPQVPATAPQAPPAAPTEAASSGQPTTPIPQASPDEAAILQQLGYGPADIASMGRAEIEAELADARDRGVKTPATVADAPSAEPVKDLTAQIGDMASGQRSGVYLSADNVSNVGSNPSFIAQIAKAISSAPGTEIVENVDGKGGVLLAKDKATADAVRSAQQSGQDMQQVLGTITGAGQGKKPGADTVVQQKQGDAVTRETVVPAADAPAAAKEMEAPGRTVETMPTADALARREEGIAAEKAPANATTGEVVGNSAEFPTSNRPVPAPEGDGSRAKPVKVEIPEDVAVAGQRVAEPTEAQKEAGNYAKGHVKLHGLDISIENPKGSTRRGTSQDGKAWEVTMPAAYGYVKRSTGADGDQVDVYVGEDPASNRVFVVDQINKDGTFDEHKVMLGFPDRSTALATYESAFSDGKGKDRIGAVTEMPVQQFRNWLKEGAQTEPLGDIAARDMRGGAEKEPAKKKSPRKPTSPSTALSFIRNAGGIRPDGDLRRIVDKARIPGLLSNRGMSPDDMLRALEQANYIVDKSGGDRPIETSVQDLYDLVERIVDGERVGEYGLTVEKPMSRKAEDAVYRDQVMRDIDAFVGEMGVRYDFSEAEEDRLFELVGREYMDIGDAIERVAIESIENEAAAENDRAAGDQDSAPFGEDDGKPAEKAADGEPGRDAGEAAKEKAGAEGKGPEISPPLKVDAATAEAEKAPETGPSDSEDVVVTAKEPTAGVPTFADAKVAVKEGDPLKVIREYLEGKGWPKRWQQLTDDQKRTVVADISGAQTKEKAAIDLASIEVEVDADVDGDSVTLKMPGNEALMLVDRRIKGLQLLKACLAQ